MIPQESPANLDQVCCTWWAGFFNNNQILFFSGRRENQWMSFVNVIHVFSPQRLSIIQVTCITTISWKRWLWVQVPLVCWIKTLLFSTSRRDSCSGCRTYSHSDTHTCILLLPAHLIISLSFRQIIPSLYIYLYTYIFMYQVSVQRSNYCVETLPWHFARRFHHCILQFVL